ncbi:MAG: hypothetical protein IT210_12225 [Armatimonadetes bacterium]|nr:hypothetical protein [Armatimonadota bacterium]
MEVTLPVDRQLWVDIHRLMEIWKIWYPHLKTVALSAKARASETATEDGQELFSAEEWTPFLWRCGMKRTRIPRCGRRSSP